MIQAQQKPRKSLRTLLMLWFLLFSVVPVAFITGFSLRKYENAIDQELSKRLDANGREIQVILEEFDRSLGEDIRKHSTDKALVYYLSTNNFNQSRDLARRWMQNSFLSRVWIYGREGRLEVALYRSESGEVTREQSFESSNVYLNEEFLKSASDKDEWSAVDVLAKKTELRPTEGGERMELSLYSKVRNSSGQIVGFLEEVILIDQIFMTNLKNRMSLEVFFFTQAKDRVLATNPDLSIYKSDFFLSKLIEDEGFFDLNIREQPFRFMVKPLSWGSSNLYLGVGASKGAAKAILKNVYYAFLIVVGGIIFVLVILSVISSKILLKPLYDVLEALGRMDFDKEVVELPTNNDTELGLLTESFNEMSRRVFEAQKALRDKIKELEGANNEIRDTQARLLHSAKMASLGQLVAGVAHELNNPIGFIYSNMAHLRDYSSKLIQLVHTAESDPKDLKDQMKAFDFDYMVEDLPKLISSCEDGARRTRDIVSGLRNFSRLEEAQTKEVDIHEGIENTLNLLSSEIKNRIEVIKEFGNLPMIMCYPSQLNQVFMNILSNAAQAIEGEGKIWVKTKKLDNKRVEISIRDSGRGMDKTTLEKIFDPFFTTKSLGRGTGLGMSISYGVIQKHGGEILVESEPGKGTVFRILLPSK